MGDFFSPTAAVMRYSTSPESVQQFEVLARGIRARMHPEPTNILDPWEQGRDYFACEQLAMVVTDFQDLNKMENAGINYGIDRVTDACRGGALVLRLDRSVA